MHFAAHCLLQDFAQPQLHVPVQPAQVKTMAPMHLSCCCCRSYAKGFGAVGALFAGSECVIEKQRAKHDIYNSVYAGCFSGGVLARSGGPQV